MSVISILGNTSPRIGTATKYVAITPYANILRNSMATSQENILWDIYVLENGKWRKTQGNSKKGKEVEYTFTQRSLLRKGIKLVANINGETGELLIKPMLALAPKILKVELLHVNYQKISKILNYTDVITARAHCVNLDGQFIDFSLWEDDVIGVGHHKDNENNHIATASAKVVKGRADVTFNMSHYAFAALIANIKNPKGKNSEGETHEYYVTAQYDQNKTASNNINIKNTNNQQPLPSTPKSSTKKNSKYNVVDKKGIIYSIELQDSKGNKIDRNIRYEETIKVVIRGHNLVNKPCVLKLWEHDTFGDNDLLYRQNIVMKNSPHEVSITLTPKMKTKGEVGFNPKNPDIGEYATGYYQEIFAEVVYGNTFLKTDTIQVSINAQPTKQEIPKSPSKVGGNNKDKKEQEKQISSSNKVMMTFDGKYIAGSNEVYINVITPKDRSLQGPLIVFDDTKIIFKTHSLCRGSNSNRLKAGGNGDTPTGRAMTSYNPTRHNGKYSFGNYGLIYLQGNSGEFLTATKNGRDGIAIHSGHTTGYANKSLKDKGSLMGTFGCIRVYNEEMKKLGEIYQELKKQGKVIYCYVEDYDGDIKDVYDHYGMSVDTKDKTRGKRSNKQ